MANKMAEVKGSWDVTGHFKNYEMPCSLLGFYHLLVPSS